LKIKLALGGTDESCTMTDSPPRYALVLSALGAVVLAIAVFLPWYGVSFTASGIAYASRVGNEVAAQFGNATLQSYMSQLHASLTGLAGRDFTSLSAHQALSNLSVVMLVLAGLAIVVSLFALAGPEAASSEANRVPLAVLGTLATAAVLYRIIERPSPAGSFFALSLREGAWLALIGSLAIVAGAVWPARSARSVSLAEDSRQIWSELSGWTPKA
jgi:hypothetical protein